MFSPSEERDLRAKLANCRQELFICRCRRLDLEEQVANLDALVRALTLELRKLRGGQDN